MGQPGRVAKTETTSVWFKNKKLEKHEISVREMQPFPFSRLSAHVNPNLKILSISHYQYTTCRMLQMLMQKKNIIDNRKNKNHWSTQVCPYRWERHKWLAIFEMITVEKGARHLYCSMKKSSQKVIQRLKKIPPGDNLNSAAKRLSELTGQNDKLHLKINLKFWGEVYISGH